MTKGDKTSAMTLERKVVAVRDGVSEEILDRVIREDIFGIRVNGRPFVSLACLPENLGELAVGFLRSEGVISERSQVETVEVDLEQHTVDVKGDVTPQMLERSLTSRFLTSGCGIVPSGRSLEDLADGCLKLTSDYIVERGTVMDLMHEINAGAALFGQTGAAHTAALALDGRIAATFEDISRHNAVDKAIGKALMEGWDTSKGIIFSSGRLSLEIVMKCASGRIPIVVSRTAPMQRGVEVADELLMTLVGFARGRRLNIYTHPWRIR
jgi:FdhD protein